MAACALPIRELSASVTLDAAKTQKKCLDVAESASQSGIMMYLKVRVLAWFIDGSFDKLATSQRMLIGKLQALNTDQFSSDHFSKLATDLGNLSSMTFSIIELSNEIPKYAEAWRAKMDTVAELAAHIDNFAESYRVASDDVCTALLATITEKITAQAAAPVH